MKKLVFTLCLFQVSVRLVTAQIPQGPNNPGTVTTGACSFSYSSILGYAPSANVVTSNNLYASASHCMCCDANTNCLTLSNFGFAIPAGSVIAGITVEIEKRASFGAVIQDNGLRLMKGGAETGANYAALWVDWPFTDTYTTYGGCTDLWGTTWTPAEINAANFGLYFAAIDYTCSMATTSYIDHVRVTVCYYSTLPLDLLNFRAEPYSENLTLLKWTTLQSIPSDSFYIERSFDGMNFKNVGNIPSEKSSQAVWEYSFTDQMNGFHNITYYRLHYNGEDGSPHFSNVLACTRSMSGINIINTAFKTETLSVCADAERDALSQVTLYALDGRELFTSPLMIPKGSSCSSLSVPVNLTGCCILIIQSNNQLIYSQRLVISH